MTTTTNPVLSVTTRPATKPKKADEPKFENLVSVLAAADLNARAASGDANQARAQRQTAAVNAIRAAFSEKLDLVEVRKSLLDGGVLKGTVSKITTVLDALERKAIGIGDVKSLNGAYMNVKMLARIAAGGTLSPGAPTTPFAKATPARVATSPEDAMKIIIEAVSSIIDPDERLKVGGEWITKITNGITTALASIGADDDE